jgi:hypothetical protein
MSLNWDITKVANREAVCKTKDGKLHPTTDTLIWATMFVGIPRITVDNVEEFSTRVSVYERLFGAFRATVEVNQDVTDIYITPADVLRHVGLSTNASVMTTAKFKRHVMDRFWKDRAIAVRVEMVNKGDRT